MQLFLLKIKIHKKGFKLDHTIWHISWSEFIREKIFRFFVFGMFRFYFVYRVSAGRSDTAGWAEPEYGIAAGITRCQRLAGPFQIG